MKEPPQIIVRNVSKKFCRRFRKSLRYGMTDIAKELLGRSNGHSVLRPGEFWAVKDVSMEIKKGEGLAILGRNGAGKSTLLRLINGRLRLDEGEIFVRGRVAAINDLGTGFNPVQTGRENIYNTAAVYGLSRIETERIVDDIVRFAEIQDSIDSPVGNYSSGMRARIGYAIAAHLDPDIFIVDEVLAAGDFVFRQKCYDHLKRLRESERILILATHDFNRIQNLCQRVVVMDNGHIIFAGDTTEGVEFYLNSLGVLTKDPQSQEALSNIKKKTLTKQITSKRDNTTTSGKQFLSIKSLSVHSSNDETIKTGSKVEIVMEYECLRPVDQATWGFLITTTDRKFRVASGFAGFDRRKYSLASGNGVFKCAITALPLPAGEYFLHGLITGPGGLTLAKLGWKEETIRFSVESSTELEASTAARYGDLVDVDALWE